MSRTSLSIMGHFTAWSMRDPVPAPGDIAIDTCSDNDTALPGDDLRWSFCNPTNRAIRHEYGGIVAVSVECLWQGTKIREAGGVPDLRILSGQWRANKAKRPIGAWAGHGEPFIVTPGDARRSVYLPAFRRLWEHWMRDATVAERIARAHASPRRFFLRDWDTGRGIDRDGPMSHAWVIATYLNTGRWPERDAPPEPVQRGLF